MNKSDYILSDTSYVLTKLHELKLFSQLSTQISMHMDIRSEFSIHSPVTIQMANLATEEVLRVGVGPDLDLFTMTQDAKAYMVFFMGVFREPEYYKSQGYPFKTYQHFLKNLVAYFESDHTNYYFFTKIVSNMVDKCDSKATWFTVGVQNWDHLINNLFLLLSVFPYIDPIIQTYNYFEKISFHPGLEWRDPFFILSQTVEFVSDAVRKSAEVAV